MNYPCTNGCSERAHLPLPETAAREHSDGLAALVREQIDGNGGSISFERYMDMVLYEPGWGYYSAGATRFGAGGDFTTAPLVSPLFSRCLARQCRQALAALPQGVILELGAGTGRMAQDLLLELEALDSLPERYLILEISADLRARQQALFGAHIPHLSSRINWLKTLPERPLSGIIIANEVIDALPVTRVLLDQGALCELRVGYGREGFHWIATPCSAAEVNAAWERIASELSAPLPQPYRTEINLRAAGWMRSLAATLKQGVMLLIDYGYPGYEYYHPQRDNGALLCHYRRRAHDDPFWYPGLQDISASVDFTALAQCALESGMQLAGYASQAHFLIGCGLTELAAPARARGKQLDPAISGQIKRLTLPGEMGERFKAIAFTRDYPESLIGFSFLDQQDRLWSSA